ncbi:MAG TPA: ABC transporter ATP-binding protein [Gemmatimonadaceae bacterium]|jgi:lipopolysaccharide transport system ATP-binding protein|nr:ABC transporter ATP-binding protein [Gemmatimonadaceae bacterium]
MNVIEARGLGKRYRIGAPTVRHDSLRDLLANAVTAPARNLRALRRLTRFGTDSAEPDDLVWALRDVSFDIAHGEVVGLVGRNGAGKSTLLKLLSRITEPSTGRAVMRGRVGSLLEVGTGFHPDLTGRENVFLNGAILGMDRRTVERRFDEIVEFAGVARFIDTLVKRYSSGMYLRLAFAVAAHLEPDILLVDEVLAVGDAQFQQKCLGKMRSVSQEGRTVVFVSHNLTAVRTLCSRALLLRDGGIAADASAADVVTAYVADVSEAVWRWAPADNAAAPHNEAAVVHAVSVMSPAGQPVDELTTSSPFVVTVDFATTHDDAFVGMTVIVYDSEHQCVFSSLSNREPDWYGRPMPRGRYAARCAVPGNLLNAGWYTVDVNLFGKDFTDQHLLREVLRLDIQDSGELRGDYFGAYHGAVRPALAWTMTPL